MTYLSNDQRLALDVKCPKCHAPPLVKCMTLRPHSERVLHAKEMRAISAKLKRWQD